MTKRRPLALLTALTLLSGCNPGGASVSGSASESASSATGLSSLWERAKSLGFETGKTYEMPALGLMADAFLADYTARGLSYDLVPQAALQRDGGSIPPLDTVIAGMIEPTRKDIGARSAKAVAKLTPLDADHMVYSAPIVIAMQPRKGWEVEAIDDRVTDPRFDTPFFRAHRAPSRYDPDAHVRYMEMLAISAIYTDTVFGMIDKDLGTSRIADPAEAQRRVLATFQAIPAATLKAALHYAAEQVIGGRFSTDLTGSGNIHFTHSPAGDFVADPRGLTWTKAGGVWFGDGRINGQTINLRLASTASLSQREAQSGTQGTSTSSDVSGTSSVGPH